MYRLFAALEIPSDVGAQLRQMCQGVPGASWRPVENFHITLRFFGEVDGTLARELDFELGQIEAQQMELTLSSIGWFGGAEPTSLWMGVEANDTLRRLSGECERAARRAGLPREKRPYKPHVTLAYCHGTTPEAAIAYQQKHALNRIGPFWTDRFHLYSSHMGKGPSKYVSEAEYPLV